MHTANAFSAKKVRDLQNDVQQSLGFQRFQSLELLSRVRKSTLITIREIGLDSESGTL